MYYISERRGNLEISRAESAQIHALTAIGLGQCSVRMEAWASINNCRFYCTAGQDNQIIIGENTKLENLDIAVGIYQNTAHPARNTVCIGAHGGYNNLKIEIEGTDNRLAIGENVHVTKSLTCCLLGAGNTTSIGSDTSMQQACIVSAGVDSFITIGEDSMFAHGVVVRTYDGHPIYNKATLEILNPARPVMIGQHTWIGDDAEIMPGSNIGERCIVGARALVTRHIPVPSGHSIVGMHSPKLILPRGEWARASFFDTTPQQERNYPEFCAESYRARANELSILGRYEEAIISYNRSLELYPHEYTYAGKAAALRRISKAA